MTRAEAIAQTALVTVTAVLVAFLVALCLAGCSAPSRWDAVGRCGSPGRHNVDASVGPRATWANGAYVQALGGRRFRVEEPSSRGFPEEWQFEIEASVPIGGRR